MPLPDISCAWAIVPFSPRHHEMPLEPEGVAQPLDRLGRIAIVHRRDDGGFRPVVACGHVLVATSGRHGIWISSFIWSADSGAGMNLPATASAMIASIPSTLPFARFAFGMKIAHPQDDLLGQAGIFAVVLERGRVGIHPVHRLRIGAIEAHQRVATVLERVHVGEVYPHGAGAQRGHVTAGRDDPDLAVLGEVEPERRRAEADIDLTGHGLR